MNDLQIFNSAEFGSVRTTTINGEPYFVGRDVAEALGYVNPRKAIIDHVDDEDKLQNDGVTIRDSIGREQHPTIINESGLYALVLSSKLATAKRFKHWVTSEVLPSIRKHGVYAVDEVLENPDMLIAALTKLKAEREKAKALEQTVVAQCHQLTEMQPKVSYYDVVLNCKDLVAISVIAKDYGWSANRMNQYLHQKGVQYRQGGKIWLLYQKYADLGYTGTRTHVHPAEGGELHSTAHTYWTQKGRLFIYDLLKADGILPTMEREHEEVA